MSNSSQSWQESLAHCRQTYREFRQKSHLANHVLLLARVIAEELEQDRHRLGDLSALIDGMTEQQFKHRIEQMRARIGVISIEQNEELWRAFLRSAIEHHMAAGNSAAQAIERVCSALWLRFVFTAHPTFALTRDGMESIVHNLTQSSTDSSLASASQAIRAHAPSLDDEYDLAAHAIATGRRALKRFFAIAFEVAEEYESLNEPPHLSMVSLASWVGYDSDGRSDISWADNFHKRLLSRIAYLDELSDDLQSIAAALPSSHQPLVQQMKQLSDNLTKDSKASSELLPAFKKWSGHKDTPDHKDDIEWLKKAGQDLHRGKHHAASKGMSITPHALEEILCDFYRACHQLPDDALRRHLCGRLSAIITLLRHHGVSTARAHMRINASQINNALRPLISEDAPTAPEVRHKRLLTILNEQLDKEEEFAINFGSLIAEPLSARRMVMSMKHMIDYTDQHTPIRFLIAECESSLTMLGGLYFLRLFGIADMVELCPLFETPQSMRTGHRIIEEFLNHPHGRAYIEQHGRLHVQIGFSDSARHIGQIASVLAIENLHMQIARLLKRENMSHITVLFFDTHGESVGRGGFAGGIGERPFYLCSPYARALFHDLQLHHEQEMSFQGGDGYLWFFDEALAFASLVRVSENYLHHHMQLHRPHETTARASVDDPLYDQPDFAINLADTVRNFNQNLMNDMGYADILLLFGRSLLFASGSRPLARADQQHHHASHLKPQDWRAIPQNAILQQLGMLPHMLGGIGDYLDAHSDEAVQMLQKSPRFRHIMTNVWNCDEWCESLVLEGYVAMRSPALWSAMARHSHDSLHSDQLRQTASLLEYHPLSDDVLKIIRLITRNYDAFHSWCEKNQTAITFHTQKTRHEKNEDVMILHALRIALLQYSLGQLLNLPDFSYQQGFSRADIEDMILHMNVPQALEILRNVFPREPFTIEQEDFGAPASYASDTLKGYRREHQEIFEPLETSYELIRRISVALMHHIGAVG